VLLMGMASTGRVIGVIKRRTAYLLFFLPTVIAFILSIIAVGMGEVNDSWWFFLAALLLLFLNCVVQMFASVPVTEQRLIWKERERHMQAKLKAGQTK